MEAIWNGSIFIPRYASPRNPHGEIPPSPPAEQRQKRESALRRTIRSWRGRLPENWQAIVNGGLVNGGMVNDGHALVNGGVIRAHTTAPPPVVLQDTFTGDGNLSGRSVTTGSATWTVGSGTWSTSSGSATKSASAATVNLAYVDLTRSAMDVSVKLTTSVNGWGLCYRVQDATHFKLVWWSSNSGGVLQHFIEPGDVQVGTSAGVGGASPGDIIRVTADAANLVTIYWNGVSAGSGTEATYATATKCGLVFYSISGAIDQFDASSL